MRLVMRLPPKPESKEVEDFFISSSDFGYRYDGAVSSIQNPTLPSLQISPRKSLAQVAKDKLFKNNKIGSLLDNVSRFALWPTDISDKEYTYDKEAMISWNSCFLHLETLKPDPKRVGIDNALLYMPSPQAPQTALEWANHDEARNRQNRNNQTAYHIARGSDFDRGVNEYYDRTLRSSILFVDVKDMSSLDSNDKDFFTQRANRIYRDLIYRTWDAPDIFIPGLRTYDPRSIEFISKTIPNLLDQMDLEMLEQLSQSANDVDLGDTEYFDNLIENTYAFVQRYETIMPAYKDYRKEMYGIRDAILKATDQINQELNRRQNAPAPTPDPDFNNGPIGPVPLPDLSLNKPDDEPDLEPARESFWQRHKKAIILAVTGGSLVLAGLMALSFVQWDDEPAPEDTPEAAQGIGGKAAPEAADNVENLPEIPKAIDDTLADFSNLSETKGQLGCEGFDNIYNFQGTGFPQCGSGQVNFDFNYTAHDTTISKVTGSLTAADFNRASGQYCTSSVTILFDDGTNSRVQPQDGEEFCLARKYSRALDNMTGRKR